MGILSSVGGAIGGYLGGKKDRRFYKKNIKAQKLAIAAMLEEQQSGMDASAEMFGQAEDQINAVGPAMRQELLARGEQGVADSTSNALSTGLSGTSAYQGMLRGSRADTGRNLGLLEESLAGARSRLYERRGSEIYGQFHDRANMRQRTKYDPFLENWRFGTFQSLSTSEGQAYGQVGDDVASMFTGGMGGMFG